MTTSMILHPACAAYPVMNETELAKLAEDIKLNGLIEPITRMPDDAILDGRCRELACRRAGVEPRYEIYTGDDPVRFVIAKNERRRHLSHAERAMIATKLANLSHGVKKIFSGKDHGPISQPEAAKLMNVSLTAVSDAKAVQTYASDHIIEMVKSGKVGLQTAAAAVRLFHDKTEQTVWTESDIRRIGNAAKQRYQRLKPEVEVKPTKEPYRNPHYVNRGTGLMRSMRLTAEESGRPPPELSGQQHPDWPAGWTYGLVHVETHGRVQVIPIKEKARLALLQRFNDMLIAISRLAEELPGPNSIAELGQRDGDKVRNVLDRNLVKAQANLADFAKRYIKQNEGAQLQASEETNERRLLL